LKPILLFYSCIDGYLVLSRSLLDPNCDGCDGERPSGSFEAISSEDIFISLRMLSAEEPNDDVTPPTGNGARLSSSFTPSRPPVDVRLELVGVVFEKELRTEDVTSKYDKEESDVKYLLMLVPVEFKELRASNTEEPPEGILPNKPKPPPGRDEELPGVFGVAVVVTLKPIGEESSFLSMEKVDEFKLMSAIDSVPV
jgi:hypothetical protein